MIVVLIVSIAYWIYLYFHTSMVIVFDAGAYEQLGRMLHDESWVNYFKTGPNREPLYPLSIALSMHMADIFHVSYQKIQLIIQVLILAVSQILLWRLLVRFNIHRFIIGAVLLYWAFSPAIVNSAFSLFSEILAYPFILLLIWFSLNLLAPVSHQRNIWVLWSGIMWGIVALALVMVKAASLYMLLIIGIWILVLLCGRWIRGHQRELIVVIAIAMGCLILQTGTTVYKSLNKRYNGFDVLTDRGPVMVYGNMVRRVEPHDGPRVKAAIALVPGEGVCRLLAKAEDCQYWQFMTSDALGSYRATALAASGYTSNDINKVLIHETKELIATHPLPVTFFGFLEGMKMLFWESTQIGFVTYPAWLTHAYDHLVFKSLLRLIMAIITGIALIGFAYTCFRSKDANKILLLLMAIAFIFLYSWVTVLTRYAFPIVPVYLLIIGCWLNSWWEKSGR